MRYSKIITIGLSIIFWFSLPLLGQQPDQKTLLWKLEGPNINSSYIFGTIHLLPQDQFEIENKVFKNYNLKLFDATGRVVRNVNINQQYRLERRNLPAGLYFYGVYDNHQLVGKGKIVLID